MAIVVDTDVMSYVQKRDTRAALYSPHLFGAEKLISFMTLAELRRWALQRNWGETRRAIYEDFLSENYGIIFADDKLCSLWAKVKSESQNKGRPIATADAWVAAVALMFDVPLVTHNRRHFENVEHLKITSQS